MMNNVCFDVLDFEIGAVLCRPLRRTKHHRISRKLIDNIHGIRHRHDEVDLEKPMRLLEGRESTT